MYAISAKAGVPVGIINDFDLASWVDYSTTNNDRTGTIPFMAIDLLNGGLDSRIPRLYRHDLESFCWVLAYVTVAKIDYKGCTIKISPLPGVDAWFKDDSKFERRSHISSKRHFYSEYGEEQGVSARYSRYLTTIQRITWYWFKFHEPRRTGKRLLDFDMMTPLQGEPVLSGPEVDDPVDSLESFI